jgi:DNA invertase Pin-like site-specific DNA recombinase
MKVAIYARVSIADQNQELQLRELQDYATRRQWEIAHGLSGHHQRRVSKPTRVEPAHGRHQGKEAR